MSFFSLQDLLPRTASKLHLEKTLQAALVITKASNACRDVFSPDVFEEISVKRYKDHALWISVTSSVIAQEVQMKSFLLQKKINEELGFEGVKKIRSFQEAPSSVPLAYQSQPYAKNSYPRRHGKSGNTDTGYHSKISE